MVSIPNHEIRQQFVSTVKVLKWNHVIDAVRQSDMLLKYTLEQNAEKVSEMLSEVHNENTSVIQYNDENSFLRAGTCLLFRTGQLRYLP